MRVIAHGIGGIRDLPVPNWLFYWGAGIVLAVSFLLLGLLWRTPLLERLSRGRPTGFRVSGTTLVRICRVSVQALSVAFFLLVLVAAIAGSTDPNQNLAPTWVYVVFWLGIPALSALLGNVWSVLSPWRALADAFVWVWERSGREARPLSVYPARLGRWPAAVALFAFVALELTYSDPSSPRALAFAIALYSYVTLFGCAAFGRDVWHASGEGFAVAFGYFARIAPLCSRGGRLHVRWPLTGLAGRESMPGSLAVLAVMLGSVAFDGFSRTTRWQDLVADVEAPYVLDRPSLGELLVTLVNLGGLLAAVGLVAVAYVGACEVARWTLGWRSSFVPEFLLSLVPIALVYAVAHYFSLFVIQGQFTLPLLSDPLGRGWDLVGTAGWVPNLTPFSPNTIWYVQVAALVGGHVAGLAIAHDRAIQLLPERNDALRSQYPMLVLMVAYTVTGLWLLSQG